MSAPTLTAALIAAGYTHRAPLTNSTATMHAREILDASGVVVATLKAHEAWAWLRARGQQVGA